MVVLKKSIAPLLILALIALIVQMAFVFETNRAVVFQIPTSDSATYHNQAVRIARGEAEPGKAPFWQPPLYVYGLAQVYRCVASNVGAARYVHGVLGVLIALLTFTIAKRFMNAPVAFACGLGTCLYGPLLFFASQLLPAATAAVLATLFLLVFLALMRRPTGMRAFAVGLVLGLAALTVPVVLVMLLLVGLWLAAAAMKGGAVRTQARFGSLVVAGLILAIAPVTSRNAVRSGSFVPISTNGGINLYIGNNPDMAETVCIRPGTRDWDALVALPYEDGAAASPAEAQSYFLRRVGAYICSEPAGFVGGLLGKAHQLLNGREIPRNIDIYVFRKHSRILSLLAWCGGWFAFPFGIVGPLALLGMIVAFRRGGEGRYIAGFVVLYGLGLVCFFPSSRYMVPMLPALLILAFIGVGGLIGPLPARTRAAYAMLLILAAVVVNLPAALPTDAVAWEAELHRHVGIGLQKRGRLDEALRQYDLALNADEDAAATHYYRGTALLAVDRLDAAESAFRSTLMLQADYAEAMHDLAVVLHRQKRTDEAIPLLARAIEVRPDYRSAMRNLAVALITQGRKEEAERWLQRAQSSKYPVLTPQKKPNKMRIGG
ncbi:MAG: tetratricopeptide repeat protein [Kiritimatiellae bacterium]|nr:tetratricopeptide repeat protein [Kiritimatiellia bacterium]